MYAGNSTWIYLNFATEKRTYKSFGMKHILGWVKGPSPHHTKKKNKHFCLYRDAFYFHLVLTSGIQGGQHRHSTFDPMGLIHITDDLDRHHEIGGVTSLMCQFVLQQIYVWCS